MMDDANTVSEFLSRVSYKPGYRFHSYSNSTGVIIRITAALVDAEGANKLIDISLQSVITSSFFRCVTADQLKGFLVCFVHGMIQKFEEHEIKEWYKVDGVHIKNPHPVPEGHAL